MQLNLTKDQVLGILREVLAFIGALLAVYGVSEVAGVNWQEIAGTIIFSAVTIWGYVDKSNKDASALMSVIRKLATLGGTIAAFYFPDSEKLLAYIVPFALTIGAILFSNRSNAPPTDTKIRK